MEMALRFPTPSFQSQLLVFTSRPNLFPSCCKLRYSQFTFTPRNCAITPRSLAGGAKLTGPNHSAMEDAVSPSSFIVKKKASDIAPGLRGTSIFLVGINNSIKKNLGKHLAEVLRYYYFDSDSLVVEAAGGEAAAKAYRDADEKGFRQSETEALKQLSSMGRLVVCAGDAAVQSSTNLALLRHGISIWIDAPLDLIAKGVIENRSQEFSSESYSEVFAQLTELYQKSKEGYAIADATVSLQKVASKLGSDDLDTIAIDDVALEVLNEIEKLTRVKKMMEEAARPF